MIMEAHAGRVDIANGDSGGAVFRLIFNQGDVSSA
jgi:nitrogen fixation/metabolism regulation signal transduction histidine kinase